MTKAEQTIEFYTFTEKMRDTLLSKGDDYANENRLSNFISAGTAVGNSAEVNCLNLIGTKIARLSNLINSNKVPNNESIQDSILDLANYAFLLNCLIKEQKD